MENYQDIAGDTYAIISNDIENPDRIYVGEQLYIPRFCRNKIENG